MDPTYCKQCGKRSKVNIKGLCGICVKALAFEAERGGKIVAVSPNSEKSSVKINSQLIKRSFKKFH